MNDDTLSKLEAELEIVSQTHRYDMTADVARRILALSPMHEQAQYQLVLSLYYSQQFSKMREAIDVASNYFPQTSWFHYVCYLYYLYEGGSKYLNAKVHIEKAIAIHPNFAHYHRSLGELFLINREPGKASVALAKAVRLSPDNPEYGSRYALALLREHKIRESLTAADVALKNGTNQPRIYDTVGMIYTLAGELDKGEELFREALRMMPTYDYFQKHIDWVLREKQDRELRLKTGRQYTPLYLRQKDTNRFF